MRTGRPESELMEMSIARKAKHCSSCGEYKNHSEFHKLKTNSDGRNNLCGVCRSKQQVQSRLSNRKEAGFKMIKTCNRCYELYTKTSTSSGLCIHCRRVK